MGADILPSAVDLQNKLNDDINAVNNLLRISRVDPSGINRDNIREGLKHHNYKMPDEENVKFITSYLHEEKTKNLIITSNQQRVLFDGVFYQEINYLAHAQSVNESRLLISQHYNYLGPDKRNQAIDKLKLEIEQNKSDLDYYRELIELRNKALNSGLLTNDNSLNESALKELTDINSKIEKMVKGKNYLVSLIAAQDFVNNMGSKQTLDLFLKRTESSKKAIERQIGLGVQGTRADNGDVFAGEIALSMLNNKLIFQAMDQRNNINNDTSATSIQSLIPKLDKLTSDTVIGKGSVYSEAGKPALFNVMQPHLHYTLQRNPNNATSETFNRVIPQPKDVDGLSFLQISQPSALLKSTFVYNESSKLLVPNTISNWDNYCIAMVAGEVVDQKTLAGPDPFAKIREKLKSNLTDSNVKYFPIVLIDISKHKAGQKPATLVLYVSREGILTSIP